MARPKSRYVCLRCGLPVHAWRGSSWKHVANQHGKSCGKPPHVYERAQLEAEARAAVQAVRRHLAR